MQDLGCRHRIAVPGGRRSVRRWRAAVGAAGVLVTSLAAGCGSGERAQAPGYEAEIAEIRAFEPELEACRDELRICLGVLSDPSAMPEDLDDAVDRVHVLAAEFTATDRGIGHVVDRVVLSHLRGSDAPMPPVVDALDGLRSLGEELSRAVDDYLASASPEFTVPEHLDAVEGLRWRLARAMVLTEIQFFRNYIPVRFVQFVLYEDDMVSEARLVHSIDVANEVFRPARVRFLMTRNNVLTNWLFHDLDDPVTGESGTYTWPDDLTDAAPLRGITYPDPPDCSAFVRPPGNTESRDMAQMRAGTYCCPTGEILVYINQGRSNGGQYPWYSRIVGMSAHHMASPGSAGAKYVFAHELGHYLGLPHTFGDHLPYGVDYSLARMVDHPLEGDPPLDQRRYYTTHANLVNPETGGTAPLSLFWDLVFKPYYGILGGVPHTFFDSRAEAAAWEPDLQPIEDWEWGNVRVCQPSTDCCGGRPSGALRLEHVVAEGFRGAEGDVSDPASPVQILCTGDPEVRAFSRFATVADRIHVNVMSYRYRLDDASASGARVPVHRIEEMFISQSQIEQIHRVLEHDVECKFFVPQTGRRPGLGSCAQCHPGAGS